MLREYAAAGLLVPLLLVGGSALAQGTPPPANPPAAALRPERAPAAPALSPTENFGTIYGTGNLAAPPAGLVPPAVTAAPATGGAPRALLLRPEILLRAQNERTQPPPNLKAYSTYFGTDPLVVALDALQNDPNLDPALLVLLAWNHVALDMTSIDHTTAGQKITFNGTTLPVFEKTFGEQFGPPRSSRALAIIHLAMFEAASAIDPRFASYKPPMATKDIRTSILTALGVGPAPSTQTASISSAVTQAAHDTLVALYPNKAPLIEASMLRISILVSAQESARGAAAAASRLAQGIAVGKLAAGSVLAARQGDGSTLVNDQNKCLPTIPGQPADTVLPAPLCWERYFPGAVPQPADPLVWTMDPISGQTLQLGAMWGSVEPFVLTTHQFTPSSGITLGGTTLPIPTATEPAFKASLDNGAYGPTIPDPRGGATPIPSRYGVRSFGGWDPAPGTPVPSGGGPRAITQTQRTDAQTIEGNFWGYDATALLCAPPRLYNMVATSIYLDHLKLEPSGHVAVEAARYLALVNLALADAGVAAWDAKFTYMVARPVTFIRNQPTDPQYPDDDIWTPLGQVGSNGALPNVTPPFPAYPSGHAVFGAAAFTIIGKALNLNKNTGASAFDFVSDEYNGHTFGSDGRLRPMMTMHFASLKAAEWENAESRIFLGIHWQRDADDGSDLGDAIAETIFAGTLKPMP